MSGADSIFAGVVGFEFTGQIDGSGWPDAVVLDNGLDVFDKRYEQRRYVPLDRIGHLVNDRARLTDRETALGSESTDL